MSEKIIYDATKDPLWNSPVVDMDEKRERVLMDGTVIPYRYVHGYFANTDANGVNVKFTYCFPEKESFKGRFFQHLCPFPGPDEENAYFNRMERDDHIGFALAHGAYFVACNMGSGNMFGMSSDPLMVYKSFAAAAEYSRVKAMEIYGCTRPFGYVYGGSGGGYKTMSCMENTNTWDGAVPHVIGSPISIPNCMCIPSFGKRILRHKIAQIIDAQEPGGSGDMYDGLSSLEKEVLKEVTALGYPPRTWFLMDEGLMDDGSLVVLAPGVKMADPEYFKDFWEKPGYAGYENEEAVKMDHVCFTTKVKSVQLLGKQEKENAGTNGVNDAFLKQMSHGAKSIIELEDTLVGDDLYLMGMEVKIESGKAAGTVLKLGAMQDNYISIGMTFGINDIDEILTKLAPGDIITIDNLDYLAIQLYYRYQNVDESFFPWSYLDKKYPGRPKREGSPVGIGICFGGAGSLQDGDIQGKTIVIEALMDEFASPWQADWYKNKVREKAEEKGLKEEDVFRLWYIDHSLHNDSHKDMGVHTINYYGAVKRALLAVSDWAERGIEPPSTTNYKMDFAQVVVPKTASERGGVQQVVTLMANSEKHAYVKVGEQVCFTAYIDVPENAGEVVSARWNFTGEGKTTYADYVNEDVYGNEIYQIEKVGSRSFETQAIYVYHKPGTYFTTVNVASNPMKDGRRDLFLDVLNIDRVRITVEE